MAFCRCCPRIFDVVMGICLLVGIPLVVLLMYTVLTAVPSQKEWHPSPFLLRNFRDDQLKATIVPNLDQLVSSGYIGPSLVRSRPYTGEWLDPSSGELFSLTKVQLMYQKEQDQFSSRVFALNKLPPHPNVVKVREVLIDEFAAYEVAESVHGLSLLRFIEEQLFEGPGVLKAHVSVKALETFARKVIFGMLQGLNHMHGKAVSHGGIKASNVLLSGENVMSSPIVKLSGFSSSRIIDGLRFSDDINAVGLVLKAILNGTGDCPTQERETSLRLKPGPFVGRLPSNSVAPNPEFPLGPVLSSECRGFVAWILAENPEDRPESAEELLGHSWLLAEERSAFSG